MYDGFQPFGPRSALPAAVKGLALSTSTTSRWLPPAQSVSAIRSRGAGEILLRAGYPPLVSGRTRRIAETLARGRAEAGRRARAPATGPGSGSAPANSAELLAWGSCTKAASHQRHPNSILPAPGRILWLGHDSGQSMAQREVM